MKEWEIEKQQILNKLIGNDGSLSFTQEVTDSSTKNYFSKTSALIANPRSSMEPWELSYVRQVCTLKQTNAILLFSSMKHIYIHFGEWKMLKKLSNEVQVEIPSNVNFRISCFFCII